MATNTNKYLSLAGLSTFWGKVKAYVDNIDVTIDGNVTDADLLKITKSTKAPTNAGTKQITFTVDANKLTTKLTDLDNTDDTLNAAITAEVTRATAAEGTLDAAIKAEVTNRQAAIEGLVNNASDGYDTLGELETAIKAVDNKLNNAIGQGGNVAAQIQTAIEALDVTDAAVDGKYVSAVSETDGKISVSRTVLPTYNVSATGTFVSVSATTLDDKGKSFEITTNDIASASDLTALTGRVTTVEGKVDALASATHFRGVADNLDSVANPANGDIVIVGNKEYIYDSVKGWVELGDTTAELQAIEANRQAIAQEVTDRTKADATLKSELTDDINNAIKNDKISVTDDSTLVDLSVDTETGKVLTIADTTKLTHAVGLAETSVQSVAGTTGTYANVVVTETVATGDDSTKSYKVAAEFHTADVASGEDKLTTAQKVKAYVDAKLNGSAHEGSTGDDNISKVVTSVTNREDGTGFDVNFTNFTAITDAEIEGLFA